jgi:hypothetical protein
VALQVVAVARRRSPAAVPGIRSQGLPQGQLDPPGDAHPHHGQAARRRPPCWRRRPPWPQDARRGGVAVAQDAAVGGAGLNCGGLVTVGARAAGVATERDRGPRGLGLVGMAQGAAACRRRAPAQRPTLNRWREKEHVEEGEDEVDQGPTR